LSDKMHGIQKDSGDVHLLRIPLPFRLREVNLYLLKNGNGAILIDTGPHTDSNRRPVCFSAETMFWRRSRPTL